MNGIIGFMMNHSNIIPISRQVGYMKKELAKTIKNKLEENNYILIYSENELKE